MSNALSAREPSMDEILASIRKIIESGDDRLTMRQTGAVGAGMAPAFGAVPSAALDVRTDATPPATGEEGQNDDPRWLDGPGEPANDRTAVIAPFNPTPQANDSRLPGNLAPTIAQAPMADASVPAFDTQPVAGRPVAEPAVAQRGEAERGDEDVLEHAVPWPQVETGRSDMALSDARQKAQSLAALSERRLDAQVSPSAMIDGDPSSAASTQRLAAAETDPSPVMAADGGVSIDWPSLDDGIGPLDDDALPSRGHAAEPHPMAVATPTPTPTFDFFDEFDEDDFASELLERVESFDGPANDAAQMYEPGADEADVAPVAQPDAEMSAAGLAEGGADTSPRAMGEAIRRLISDEASHRVSASFSDLAVAIRDDQLRSIDDTVRDMLRPMLQEWLDDNLPHLVERLVREEIERVARGGAGGARR